ncbi:hypothetical protein SK128_010572 [Halocaridina rubra]|uniref:RING-type domain-containing protein n=1 Tax=Halocaridina rubra TaxID=373956 RepID=A0AAN8XG78_HALRR
MLVTMEERLNQMNAVLQAMQKTLECNICLDLMNKPLTTKCGHSFCSDCIQQVVKNTRNNAQCPLCMCSVTRRSLGQNNKITNLVTAVRNIISSIKRDCCFEVTPSKYRPKRRPVIACEEDDSENEENDEPRRGTRKRGVTTHYIPEVHVPKPRSKSAKQRILASNGDQELNLCMDGGTEKSTLDHLNLSSSKSNSDVLHSVIREHSYSSPTKQEPQERISARAGAQVSKGRGRLSTRGKAGSYSRKSAKTVPPKSLPTSVQHDDHVEEAKQISFVSQEEQDNIFFRERTSNNVIAEPSEHLNEKLRCEKSSDKVAKWLDTSREMGFRIGLKHSSDSTVSSSGTEPSQGLQSTKRNSINNPNSTLQASVGSAVTDEKFDNNPKSLKRTVTSSAANGSRQSSNHLETAKFFKSKMKTNLSNAEKDVAVDISTVPYKSSSQGGGSPGDPYKFIPSQKTPKPKKTVAKRGRGTKTGVRERSKSIFGKVKGRGRGCSSSSNSVFRRDSSFNYGLGNRSRMPQTQSTPSIKGRSHVPDIDLSIVKAVDISHQSLCGHVESTIVHSHDDVDDDYDIPDSCPVNTKDEFDDFVGNVKEKVIAVDCEEKTNNDPEEDKEANLLFVTPAQGPDSAGPEEKEIEGLDTLNCKKVTVGKAKGVPKNKDTRLRKGSCSSLESSSSSTKSTKHQHKSKAVKAREEVEEICSMFEEVDGHELSIITTKEDEKQKRNMEMTKANSMRQNISVLNQTADNTQLNKTIGSVEITENSMPPPRVPVRNKRVKFNANLLQNHVDCNMSGKNAMSQKQRSGNRVLLRDNVRYGSDMKRKILDPGKVIPVSVCVRDTKSPGWSHVIGARKDLKTRHTSLNITGGEHKSVCDVRTESGTNGYSSQVPMSTSETNVTIEDKSQDFDVESLNCSQSKTELVKKLKEIVTQLKTMAGNGSKNPDMGEEVLQEQDNSETKETVLGKDVQVKSGEVKHPQLASEENAVTVIHPSETEAFDNIENYVKELVLEPQAKKRKAKNLTDVDEDNISSKASKLARKKGQRENSSEIHHQVKPNSYQSAENPEDIANHMEKGEISPEKSVSASNSLSSSLQSKKASRKTYNLECNKKRNLENTETSKTVDISKVTEEQKEKIKSNISSAVISSNFGHNGAEGSELSVASVTQIHEENSSELHRNSVSEASHISCTPSQSVVVESPSAEHPERRDQPLYIISHNFNDGNIQPPYIVNHDLSDGNSQSHQVISRDISSGQVLASSTTGISHKKSKLIPFKAMGSLCTSKSRSEKDNVDVGSVNRPCLRNSKRRKNVAKDAKRKTGNNSSCEEKPKQCDLQSIESSASKKIDSSSELLCSTVNSSSCQKDRYNTVTRHTDATAVDTASSKKSDILLESFSSVDTESMSCSNNNEESQQSESLLSSVKISDTKQSTPSYGSNSVATINKVAKITGISPRREKPPQSFPKLRERNVGMATRSAVSAERGVDTEKREFQEQKGPYHHP